MGKIMQALRSLLPLKEVKPSKRPKPSWEETVERLNQKPISCRADAEILRVIYSADREKRIILIKSIHGFYQYSMERIEAFDDEEWKYIAHDPNALPAMWSDFGRPGHSFFGTEQELWNDLVHTPEYRLYFTEPAESKQKT